MHELFDPVDQELRSMRLPATGETAIGAGLGGTASEPRGEMGSRELVDAIKELTTEVRKLRDQMDKQNKGQTKAGYASGGSGIQGLTGDGAKNTFDLLKRAVASSGNAMIGRVGGSSVARTGAAVAGGAAEGAGAVAAGTSAAAGAAAAEMSVAQMALMAAS